MHDMGMHETDGSESADTTPAPAVDGEPPVEATPEADTELDGFESDLDAVASALDALDADDLDAAESLVAGLAHESAPATDDG